MFEAGVLMLSSPVAGAQGADGAVAKSAVLRGQVCKERAYGAAVRGQRQPGQEGPGAWAQEAHGQAARRLAGQGIDTDQEPRQQAQRVKLGGGDCWRVFVNSFLESLWFPIDPHSRTWHTLVKGKKEPPVQARETRGGAFYHSLLLRVHHNSTILWQISAPYMKAAQPACAALDSSQAADERQHPPKHDQALRLSSTGPASRRTTW